tara:strand:+ start:241 stop:729 length:489 start_codon:yes stop_codon:yes gene_type:complete
MMLEFILVSMLAYEFPSYFDVEQEVNAAIIIDKSLQIQEDPHYMVALAWTESRLKSTKVSRTNDYGIFQVNYRFWGKRWGYTTPQKFLVDMASPAHATVAAAVVLKEMRKYKACQGLNLAACYNGGPAWQRSKNKEKIIRYATQVNRMRGIFKRSFPRWMGR